MTRFLQLLADIEAQPLMYLRHDDDIEALYLLFAGYAIALHLHGIDDDIGDFNAHFTHWMRARTGWNTTRGWVAALRENGSSDKPLLATFLLLARQFFAEGAPRAAGPAG
jgi:hypothetical protein